MAFCDPPNLSRKQLRHLWDWDWKCANKWMGTPLRACSSKEPDEGSDDGISDHQLQLLKEYVEETWRSVSTIFDIEGDPCSDRGLYLIIKKTVPMKVTLKSPPMDFGWVAQAPEDGDCAHLYLRSATASKNNKNLYMGGPVSMINWYPPGKANVEVLLSSASSTSGHKVRLSTLKSLSPGSEAMWSYGMRQMPDFPVWFKPECCSIQSNSLAKERHKRKRERNVVLYRECCPLCGYTFSTNNQEARVQRKPHFVQSHADYFGSAWDGSKFYQQQVVRGDTAVLEADLLDCLLTYLMRDMKGRYIPACKVFSSSELDGFGNDQEALMDEFRRRSDEFLKTGTVILRGNRLVKSPEDLAGITPSVWRTLNVDEVHKLHHGRYAVPEELKQNHLLRVCEEIDKFTGVMAELFKEEEIDE